MAEQAVRGIDTMRAEESAVQRFVRATEVDTRMLGMVGALLLIWVGFDLYAAFALGRESIFLGGTGAGNFLSPRNLFTLSVQAASVAVMATGMVLIIVTRNIDLSVGSILGFVGMIMGMTQVVWLPPYLELGHPLIWVITLIVGLVLGAAIGGFHGWLVAYREIPSFIVTLGGLLVWRGAAWWVARGETIAPLDPIYRIIGGQPPTGTIGEFWTWVVAGLICAAIVFGIYSARRQRIRFQFPVRPVWAEILTGSVGCAIVLATAMVFNSHPLPPVLAKQYAEAHGIPVPANGELFISHGFAVPVLIALAVAFLMNFMTSRTRFGRYVFAIGGNPEAADLAGVNTKRITVMLFALMGVLCTVSAAISTARLNAATNALGVTDELYVIAAAVVGGTSLAGGAGTIYGALLGALVMQSLQSGMVLVGVDSALQNMVVGAVLIIAVWIDTVYRKRAG